MGVIALLTPAAIAVWIRIKREQLSEKDVIKVLLSYMKLVLWINFLSMVVVTYILRISDVNATAFDSFPFFIKYAVIASFISFVWAYVSEVINKYISVKFTVEDAANNEEDN